MAAPLLIVPALVMGLIIGVIELMFVHSDERGMGWLGHGLHAIPVMMFFIFISMNVEWAMLTFFKIAEKDVNIWVIVGVRALIAVIATAKIGAAAAIAGRVGEKLYHSLIIGVLVAVAPYIWIWALGPALAPVWPYKSGMFAIK